MSKSIKSATPKSKILGKVNESIIDYVNRFQLVYKKSASNVLELAGIIGDCYRDKSEEEFKEFCKAIGYTTRSSYVSKMKTIHAAFDRLAPVKDSLPGNYTTIYDLARMPQAQFDELAEEKGISPLMKAPKVAKSVGGAKPATNLVVKVVWGTMNRMGIEALKEVLKGFDQEWGCSIQYPKTVQPKVMDVPNIEVDFACDKYAANDSQAKGAA